MYVYIIIISKHYTLLGKALLLNKINYLAGKIFQTLAKAELNVHYMLYSQIISTMLSAEYNTETYLI